MARNQQLAMGAPRMAPRALMGKPTLGLEVLAVRTRLLRLGWECTELISSHLTHRAHTLKEIIPQPHPQAMVQCLGLQREWS